MVKYNMNWFSFPKEIFCLILHAKKRVNENRLFVRVFEKFYAGCISKKKIILLKRSVCKVVRKIMIAQTLLQTPKTKSHFWKLKCLKFYPLVYTIPYIGVVYEVDIKHKFWSISKENQFWEDENGLWCI